MLHSSAPLATTGLRLVQGLMSIPPGQLLGPLSLLRHALHTSARSAAAAGQQQTEVPVAGGTLLQVQSATCPVDIRSRSGGDTALLQFGSPGAWTWATQTATDGRDILRIQEESAGGQPLVVTIPDKWIGVHVETKGQPVSVAKVVEANLDVHSHGGDVELGQVRAYNATVTTLSSDRCGQLTGQELSGCDVAISTGHARVALRRLVGQRVRVSLHDRPLDVGALYAEAITCHTGGGDLRVGTLDVSESAGLHTEGGRITVDSLDGNADLHSNGGAIEAHLHSKVGVVRVASGGGSVRVAISPQACVEVDVKGASTVTCSDADKETDARTGERVWHFKPQDTSNTRYGQLSEGRVVVDAHGGPVEITRVGWMQALKQRLASAASK